YWSYQLARQGKSSLADTNDRLEQAKKSLQRLREQKSEQVTQMDVYKLDFYKAQVDSRVSFAQSGAHLALAAVRLLTGLPASASVALSTEDLPEPMAGGLRPVDDYAELAGDGRPELRAITAGLA